MIKKTLILCICFCVFIGTKAIASVEKVDLNLLHNEIAVTFLELSNGEATLIQSNDGKNVLINTGGKGTEEELLDRLEMYNVLTIDTLIITNNSSEYIGNLGWLIDSYVVKQIVLSKELQEVLTTDKYMQDIVIWEKGEKYEVIPGMTTEVLYSNRNDEGISSMILLFVYGNNHFLYMGIADNEIEKTLLHDRDKVKAEIIKLPNFAVGGTSQLFLEAVDPQVAIIFHKENSLPSQEVMERLNETWIDVYQTVQMGNVTIKCDVEKYEVITVPVDLEE